MLLASGPLDTAWLTPSLMACIAGAVLLLLGVRGGDAEIKEIRIPKVEGAWRILAAVFGASLFLLGSGVFTSITAPNTGSTANAFSPAVKPASSDQRQSPPDEHAQPKPDVAPQRPDTSKKANASEDERPLVIPPAPVPSPEKPANLG